ncbi:conserved hypothetical protein [gamma proteobacterium NOR5-3]|nr:conserved hypothetical protein [gamma proteobacterium NOR5-3]
MTALATLLLRQQRTANTGKRRQQDRKAADGSGAGRIPSGPYAAVSVKPSNNPCSAVLETSTLRYLKSAAPSLPVTGCNRPDCQCSFIHHQDRRTSDDEDRRMGIGLQTQLYGANGESNRRGNRRGRRLRDHH